MIFLNKISRLTLSAGAQTWQNDKECNRKGNF